jgi:hypothetical protein
LERKNHPLTSNGHLNANVDQDEESEQVDSACLHHLLERAFLAFICLLRDRLPRQLKTFCRKDIYQRKEEGGRNEKSDAPSCVLSLKTTVRRTVLTAAMLTDTRKWKDHRCIWANCVAASGDAKAPRPYAAWRIPILVSALLFSVATKPLACASYVHLKKTILLVVKSREIGVEFGLPAVPFPLR